MANPEMAKWRQGGKTALAEGGDEVQRSIELLDRVLSEFDDHENGNVPEDRLGAQGPRARGVREGSTPEDEEEEDRSHQSEDDGYVSMNGRRVVQRPPPPPPREEEEVVMEEEEAMPPPIPPLPVAPPTSPPLPPLPPFGSAVHSNEDEDFPPPPEEAERIISTLLPRVSPSSGSGRVRNSGRGRLVCGWASLGPPVISYRTDDSIDPELSVEGYLVTSSTQTTLPQTRHQRPYGWNLPVQQTHIPKSSDENKPRRLAEGKHLPPLPPLRFGSLPLDSRPIIPSPLPPRTLPGAGERHRVVRRRDEVHSLLVNDHQVPLNPGEEESSDGSSRKSPAVGGGEAVHEEETFSDDSLEAVEAAPRPPPSPSFSASSTSPPGSEDGKRRSVAWELSLEELDALAEEEEGGGESAAGTGMMPGCTRVARGRRSSSSDRSLASSEPRSMDDRSGSWRGRRSASSVSMGLHLSSNGEEEYSGSGLEGGGEATADLDEMANADMAMLSEVDVAVTTHEVRGGLKGTYVIRKKKGRAGIAKGREEEIKMPKDEDISTQNMETTPSETSWTSSPDSDDKRNPKNSSDQNPDKPTIKTPKHFSSRIPRLENSRIPIPENSRVLVLDGSKVKIERSSPTKNVVYLSASSPKSPEKSFPEPNQVVVKITESGNSTVVMGEQVLTSSVARPNELPDLRKTSRPNTPMDRTPERRNASGKTPPAPPPRTVTAYSPTIVKSPLASPSTPEPTVRMSPITPTKVLTSTAQNESSVVIEDSRPECDIPASPIVGNDSSKCSIMEMGAPEATSTPVSKGPEEIREQPLKSPLLSRKLPQAPPRPMPRVLSMPAIAICAGLVETEIEWKDQVEKPVKTVEEGINEKSSEEKGNGEEVKVNVEAEKEESVEAEKKECVEEEKKEVYLEEGKEEVSVEAEKKEVSVEAEEKEVSVEAEEKDVRVEAGKKEVSVEAEKKDVRVEVEKKEVSVEAEEKEVSVEAEEKDVRVEAGKKEVSVEAEKKDVRVEAEERSKEEEKMEIGEEKGERDVRERETKAKEQVSLDELSCFLREPLLPLQRSSTMPAVEESSPHKIAPSASASSFPPLPPSPIDEYSEVYDCSFFMRKLPRIPPPDGPLPPSPPSDSPPPPPPHSMAFHRPNSLKSRSMDGGFPKGPRRTNGRKGEASGERRTLPSELQCASGRRRRRDDGEMPLSPVPSPPPHAPAHLPAPPSLPETPIFSPRKADVPRMYTRRGETNGEAMRHPSGAMTAGPGVHSGYSLCGTVSTSSTASSSPFRGGLGPGRGWYPRHRNHPTATTHHLHPAHNRPRPASTEHLDRLASGPLPTSLDLHGYGPARAVVGGGAGVTGMYGARKPLTLPPNLTPKFFHRSPREALRRVTSLLIRNRNAPKEGTRRDAAMTSPNAAGPSSPPAASGEASEGGRGKRGFFKSFWKRSRHYSLEHQ